jgi:hypothetical protein
MDLEGDERLVLDDGPLGFRKKLTLTNKRLIVQEGKGLLSVKWHKTEEIPMRDIAEAYVDVGSFIALSTLVLRLKNGQTREFKLKLSDSQMLGASMSSDMGTSVEMRVKFVTDRWVTAINQLIK